MHVLERELLNDRQPIPALSGIRKIERREWWLWSSAVLVTVLLTLAIVSFVFPILHHGEQVFDAVPMLIAVRGLAGVVLLFDIFTIYQQLQIHQIRRKMMEREEMFRLITESAVDMIAVVGSDGQRIYNSPSYQKILGYAPDDLQSTSSLEQVHPDDQQKVKEAAEETWRTGVGKRIEYRMRHKDGTWRLFESTASAVQNRDGKGGKLIVVNRDVTEHRHLAEQFRQAQKMEAIGRLSGGVAHDFNNLLGVIIGYAEILQDGKDQPELFQTSVAEILKAGNSAASLTRQLLAFSRQQVLELQALDLNAIVGDLGKMFRRLIGEDIQLSTNLDPNLGTVKADRGQLEQVLLNLTVNARDAMPEGGRLLIETSNFYMDEAFVRKYPYPVQTGNYVLLKVADTGTGMDAATQARMFEPFFTTKEKGKGTGLGLSTVYGVVKQTGGYIDVSSEVGVGTTFWIYLPRVDAPVAASAPASGEPASRAATETILLVEDDASLRLLTRNLLRLLGYTILEAENGAHALEVARQTQREIHLLLTDVVMPGLGGRALAKEFAKLRPHTKVIFMSGYTGQAVGESGSFDAGTFFIQKPFTRDGLAQKVREALRAGVPEVTETAG
jgi:two-component system cell cycle sensor histidine kinase/response regulator CckA